jgi:hypothetical protein
MLQKTDKAILDIELLKNHCLEISKTITELYKTLNNITENTSVYHTVPDSKKLERVNSIINGFSVAHELEKYFLNELEKIDSDYVLIFDLYSSFAGYMQKVNNVDIRPHLTPQKIGMIASLILSEGLTINKGRTATGVYYTIKRK